MDTLAEWLRRRPAKPMGSPRVGSNPTGVDVRACDPDAHAAACVAYTKRGRGEFGVVIHTHVCSAKIKKAALAPMTTNAMRTARVAASAHQSASTKGIADTCVKRCDAQSPPTRSGAKHVYCRSRAVPGIEPRTSRTLSENYTTRPNSRLTKYDFFANALTAII